MYDITQDYIRFGNARSGLKNHGIRFIVSHDIGKGGSTARQNRSYFHNQQPSASAHTFIDDKEILEIIPLYEKAWHVRYNVTKDNAMYGDDANDIAIGVELCHGGSINFEEAYNRYVWYHAYLCKRFDLDPRKDIVPHSFLDPGRRSDPQHALHPHGITWDEFINDVVNALNEFGVSKPNKKIGSEVTTMILREGDKNASVETLQENLIKLGFKLPQYGADGDYGEETKNAVIAFQKKYGLEVDGVAGPQTLGKIAALLKPKESVTVVLGGKKYKITEV